MPDSGISGNPASHPPFPAKAIQLQADERKMRAYLCPARALTGKLFLPRFQPLSFLLLLALALPAHGQQKPGGLTDLSMEDLMSIQVSSVSKKDQKISQAAAAIFVITQDDIRRSGATTIPDLLRMVPGVDVAQINANNWAVSARGFNAQFSDKLLVLIDGRAVYTPLLAGVNWDTQDVPLEDIDRIEVIRGPGATLWGANAVNGVINIMTKKAAETQGGLVSAGSGTEQQAMSTAQYGGTIGQGGSYRVFSKYLDDTHFPDPNGQNAQDDWHLLRGGFRMDQNISQKDSLTVQGDLYTGREGASIIHIFSIDPPVTDNLFTHTGLSGGNVLGRWTRAQSKRSDTTLQIYFDNYTRTGPEADETRNTFDLDFNHHLAWGNRHDWVWGGGYRRSATQSVGTIDQAFVPANQTLQLFSSFVQDQITLRPDRIFLTLGSKLEHNDYDGFQLQPNARLAWTPSSHHTFWTAVSRASRSPSRKDGDLVAALAAFPDPGGSNTPVEVILYGNPRIKSEHVVAYEAGYRAQPGARISVDISTFFNVYDHVRSAEPGTPFLQTTPAPARTVVPLLSANELHGTTAGFEISANYKPVKHWSLSPGYSLLTAHLHASAISQDTTTAPHLEGSSPRHQAQLRSHLEIWRGVAWDAAAYFVDRLPAQLVPAYTRADTQLSWQNKHGLTVSLVGQNLVRDRHVELLDALTLVNPSLVKRSAYAKITWSFSGK